MDLTELADVIRNLILEIEGRYSVNLDYTRGYVDCLYYVLDILEEELG